MTEANSFAAFTRSISVMSSTTSRKYRARSLYMAYCIFIPYSGHFLIIIKTLDNQSLFVISREATFRNNLVGQSIYCYLVYFKTMDSTFRALIGCSNSEYPELFTTERRQTRVRSKMALRFVTVKNKNIFHP